MWGDLCQHLAQHVELCAAALAAATLLGLSLGIAAAYLSGLRAAILALASIGRTLPSLAVLTLLLPVLGVGAAPAIVALTILALPPILINVDLAIRGVPSALIDAASGMGMNGWQRFVRVVLPSAYPIALVGVRTAATEVIASATLATFIGGGGLGDDIVRGLQTDDAALLGASAALVAALALGVDLAFAQIANKLEALA